MSHSTKGNCCRRFG